MAEEDVATYGSSVASQYAPMVDRLRRSTSENESLHSVAELDQRHFMFIVDDNGTKYPIPWKQNLEYKHFKSYVEEIYARNGDEDQLDQVQNGKFDATYDVAGESHVILPSLWTDLVHEGMTVCISFGPRSLPKQTYSPPEDKGVEFVDLDVDVDVGHERRIEDRIIIRDTRDEDSWSISSVEKEISIHSDEDASESSESESDNDDDAKKAPHGEPIRVVREPVSKEGTALSFRVDTRWAAKRFAADKEKNGSEDSLAKNPRDGRDMVSEILRITRASTTTTENRATLDVYTLPGPETEELSSSIAMKWFHLYAPTLDWAQFKNTCLKLPDISERRKLLIAKTLQKVEKEYIKTSLGGMFIEPGTVLRSDECNQPEPSSVIFSCTPYFDIRKNSPPNTQGGLLHPARTLVQSFYPYEPVRDRDKEQAYRKFEKAQPDALIYVPSLWMLNVDDKVVVTCGYDPLSTFFTKSLELLQEELKQRGTGSANTKKSIRLGDPEGRVLLYSLEESGTYFQIEQRMKELRRFINNSRYPTSPEIVLQQQAGKIRVTPSNWPAILRQPNSIFVDLSLVESVPEETNGNPPPPLARIQIQGSVKPFYLWPSPPSKVGTDQDILPADKEHSTKCLEQVEKAMLNETLPESDTGGPVDTTFTSTQYYESLPLKDFEDVKKILLVQAHRHDSKDNAHEQTHHQTIVRAQSSKLSTQAYEFVNLVHDTLALFVESTDRYAMLQRLWGALDNVTLIIERLGSISGCKKDPKEYTDPRWKTPKTGTRSWRIRTPKTSYTYANQHATNFKLPLPHDDNEFGATVKKCKRCARELPFNDPNTALDHLRKHASIEASKQGGSASSSFVKDVDEWKDWIRNDDQALIESTLAGACLILDHAIQEARLIHEQLRALADGVRDAEGNFSELYYFPRKLLETLHRLLIFYFAVERSMYHTEKCFNESKKGGYSEDYPYTDTGLQVLDRFSGSVKSLVKQARTELCEMVRTQRPKLPAERMLWGADSISSWLMRRLIVKPLVDGGTVGDMYRDYLHALQFQVNHHPGKRLLRSINLLQEELTMLARVNEWQTQLVQNYLNVLNDASYPTDIPSRRALFPHESRVLNACIENLDLTRQEYQDLFRRCGPLSETTKQSAEINEEDHGKAILVFTVVTVIFLPLSFVTSYLGMNTSDIRDMESKQSLFWEIALPLTVGVMAIMLAIAYNGDEIRDFSSSVYRALAGKQDRSRSERGISVPQRNRAPKSSTDSATTLSVADEAEYAAPRARPDYYRDAWYDDYYEDRDDHYYTEKRMTPRNRYGRPPERRLAFPTQRSEAVPLFEPIAARQMRPRRTKSFDSDVYSQDISLLPPPPPPPRPRADQPTYTKINKNYIKTSALENLSQPWEEDPSNPDFVIVKGQLTDRERSRLVAQGKTAKRGRRSSWYDEEFDNRMRDRRRMAKDEYVWESKRGKEKRSRQRGRGEYRYRRER